MEETKAQIADLEQQMQKGREELQALHNSTEKVRREYTQLVSWADMYDNCTFEAKKMIVAQFVKSVSVRRDYEIDITFNVSFSEFQEIYLEPETEEEKRGKDPVSLALTKTTRQAVQTVCLVDSGGPDRIRTDDPYNANVVRSQLRYRPV